MVGVCLLPRFIFLSLSLSVSLSLCLSLSLSRSLFLPKGKGYKTGKEALLRGGYVKYMTIEKTAAPSISPSSKTPVTKATVAKAAVAKVPIIKAMRLIKPYKSTTEEEEKEEEEGEGEGEGEEDEEEEEGRRKGGVRGGGRGGRVPIVLELPLSIQGYQLIDSRGPDGLNNAVSGRREVLLA